MFPVLLYASERTLTSVHDHNHHVNILKVLKQPSFLSFAEIVETMVQSHLYSLQAVIYQGNVLALYMSKPPAFKYKSGMYLFVKCPDISSFEW